MNKALKAFFFAATMLGIGLPYPSLSKPLTTAEQLQMYRYCRGTYSDYSLYFAKKMCGCIVQAYMHDVPVGEATSTCINYAKSN
jgi:hypothetical protein